MHIHYPQLKEKVAFLNNTWLKDTSYKYQACKIAVLFLFILLALLMKVKAQRTEIYENNIRYYNTALELYDKEKFAAAEKHFLNFAAKTTDLSYRINAEYYAGVCAMELFNGDAVKMLTGIIQKYPENTKAKMAAFQLGKFYYRSKLNKPAVEWLGKVQPDYLAGNDLREYWFIYGYSLFKTDRFEQAKNAFKNIKDERSKYYDATNYYYGYVSYHQGAYDEALEHFLRIKHTKTFGPLSSIYVTQIYFSRKQYQEVINYCDTITNREIAVDVAGMLGQSYYMLGNYPKAIPHLEKFMSDAPVAPSESDIYRLGYAYFSMANYEKAIEQFLKIADDKDTLAQFALYHLGKSYLETGKKPNARTAFDKAYKLNFNQSLTELSLFNAAKLSYELSMQSVALNSLVKFVNEYPESKYIDEARSDLSSLLLSTKNFKEAIKIIESIKNPNDKDLTAFQRVCYYRAEELYLNNDYKGAAELFKKSAQYEFDKKIYALSHFWMGELAYKEGAFERAAENYKKFLSYEEVKTTRFYNMAFYNLGYAYLKSEEYTKAIEEFTAYTDREATMSNPEVYTDAVIRIADCYFVQRSYEKAIGYYNLVINKKLNGADYALFQKALILGVLGKTDDKIAALKQISTQFPSSTYIDDALFETAKVYLQTERYAEAISGFQNIITNYPRSIYVRKAMLNKGLVLFNMNKDDEALDEITLLIKTFPNTDESREALVLVRNILVNKGESDKLETLYKKIPNVMMSPGTQDSITYESAFNNYKANDCTKAARAFGNYLTRFPGGFFVLKANYFKAECEFRLKNYDEALTSYEFVVANIRSDYSERSTRQAAVIHFMKKNYEKAYEYYAALERIAGNKDNLSVALLGQMRSAMLLNKADTAAAASFKYINSSIAQKDGLIEARFNTGRFYMSRNKPDSAYPDFQYVVKETKSVMAAEAKYNLAYIQFMRKEYKTAQKTVFELNDNYSSFEFWVARGYILLADIYLKLNDTFQAKATLQSIIDGYEGDDLRTLAKEKLQLITEEENNKKNDQKKQLEERIKSKE